MIPKIIHYCWFGGNLLPELSKKCISSWKKYLPDYEIKEWNEQNFDLNSNQYAREAFISKKWAFISDYVRLYVLYYFGGIYMDTDIEVIKNLDIFLRHKAFTGFEDNENIQTGIMASEKENKWIKKLLDYYKDKHFIKKNCQFDLTTNVRIITNITLKNYNFKKNNTYQELSDITIYPTEYFCPISFKNGKIKITNKTYCIHFYTGSWHSESEKKLLNIRKKIYLFFGDNIFSKSIILFMKIPIKIIKMILRKN